MAKQNAKETSPAETPEAQAEAQAAAAEEQTQAEAEASESREAEMERRGESRKTYPEDAEAPPSQVSKGQGKGKETAYSQERLIAEATDFLGVPSHVAAGALHGNPEAYLTVDEARVEVEKYENQHDSTTPKES